MKKIDADFIDNHCEGWLDVLESLEPGYGIEAIAQGCRLPDETVRTFYNWFAEAELTVSLFSQGVNQSSSGSDKVNAIINCHLATGRIGKPGMGPFSLTGQPNAMGGREVGGLAHQLAAHMDFSNPADIDRVRRFWESPNIALKPGLPAVELFDAVHEGKIKAVWIMGTNPVVSMPDADKVKAALKHCELVVVSDCIARTDTSALAQVLLPAQGWSEKDGTVTNSERRISRQRALFAPAGQAMPDWWIISQVGQRMGFKHAFDYRKPADIFREHAALSGFENNAQFGLRDFDISGLAAITDQEYDGFQPVQWPVNAMHPDGCARLFTDFRFFTGSGKAQLISVRFRRPANEVNSEYPLILNTGRIRDQWHTMTRTGLSAKLNRHRPESFVEVHPEDAKRFCLSSGGLAEIESRYGKMLARVVTAEEQLPGSLFVPMHWSDQFARHARVGALVNPEADLISRQPELKHTPARIKAFKPAWYGFILTRRQIGMSNFKYSVMTNNEFCYRHEVADFKHPNDWRAWAQTRLSGGPAGFSHWQEYKDTGRGEYRAACIQNGRLESVIFISPDNNLPDRNWLTNVFEKQSLDILTRKTLLSGLPPADEVEQGNIVCSCFNVGEKVIKNAIKLHQLRTVQEITQCLKAGGNCGSCLSEIQSFLK